MDRAQAERLTRLIWAKAKYKPSIGEWPICGLDGEHVITSRGQQEIHDCDSNLILVSGGVRGGKSQFLAMDIIRHMFVNNGLVWIVGPDYVQAAREFELVYAALHQWDFVADDSTPKRGGRELTTPWGCKLATKSSDDTKTLASYAPHYLAGVEMGQQSYEAYEKLRERAIEHNAKVVMSGTFEGSLSWYPMLWEKWQGQNEEGGRSFSLPTWSNTFIFDGTPDDPKVQQFKRGIPDELYLERVAAIPFKPSGLVHKGFNNRVHMQRIEFDPELPIEIAVDPATHTYAVVAVQWEKLSIRKHIDKAIDRGEVVDTAKLTKAILAEERTRVYVVDEVYRHDVIAQEIVPEVQAKPWFPYVRTGVIDQAGSTRNANLSQVDIWRDMTGIAFRWNYVMIEQQPPLLNLRLRSDPDMGLPTVLFSHHLSNEKDYAGRAQGIIAELGLYQYPKWAHGKATTDRPIDANNDAIKALCYWLYDKFGPVSERRTPQRRYKVRKYGLV